MKTKAGTRPRFRDIERLTKDADYRIDVGWDYLER